MHPLYRTIEAGWELDEFEEMVPVSTYLVAFAVTDFLHTDSNENDHVLFRSTRVVVGCGW